MRIAYVSPLPPSSSGIADYSATLAPRLADAGLELELFHEGRTPPPGELGARFRCRPVSALASTAEAFDLVLYQLGNSLPHHAGMLEALLEIPGAVVLHEVMLHHLVRERTLVAGDPAGYVEEMRYCAGETGRRAAQRLLDTHYPVDVWSFPLFERVVDRSRVALVHSEFARRRILASRPGARVERVPYPVEVPERPPDPAAERTRAREELGLAPDSFVLGSFGFVTPQKRLDSALAAFSRFRAERPDAAFLVAGEVSPHYDLDEVLAEHGREGVRVTGRLAPESFRAAMRAIDAAVNLRHPTGGETSAALLALLAEGVPAIVTRAGSFAEIPAGAVAPVALDEHEGTHLLELYRALAANPELRSEMGAAARRYVGTAHALPAVVPEWTAALERAARAPREVAEPAPPLAAWDGVDPRLALAARVGSDLADLGVGDGDRDLLAGVAAVLDELDLGPRVR